MEERGENYMTLNLFFLTITFQKKIWKDTEIMQQQEIQKKMDENRVKIQRLGYVSHLM